MSSEPGPTSNPTSTSEPTDGALIDLFIEYREWMQQQAKLFRAHVEPIANAMDDIQSMIHKRLLEREAQNTKSSATGAVAFFHHGMSVKCVDKDKYLRFCMQYFDTWGKDLLTAAASKDVVKLFIEKTTTEQNPQGYAPDGLEVVPTIEVQFRKGS